MVLGPLLWAEKFGITSEDQFIEECSPWWPESAGYILRLDRVQMLKIAYAGGEGNPLTTLAWTGLMAEKRFGQLDTTNKEQLEASTDALLGGSKFMAPLVIPNVGRIAIVASANSQPVVNVIGVRLTGGTIDAAVAAVKARWEVATGSIRSNIHSSYQQLSYQGTDLSTADGAIAERTGAGAGGSTAEVSTNGASALMKLHGGTRSRSGNGRMYLGPLGEGSISADGRTLAAGFVTGFNTAMTTFRNGLETDGFPLVVISQTKAIASNVISASVDPIIAMQRRRIR